MDVDERENENELAIEAILEDNERLEVEQSALLEAKGNGKQKAPKSPAYRSPASHSPDINVKMWKKLQRLELQLKAMKRPREDDIASNAKGESSSKKSRMDRC